MNGNLSNEMENYELNWIAGRLPKIHSLIDISFEKIEAFDKTLALIEIETEIAFDALDYNIKLQFSNRAMHQLNV